MGMPAMHFPCRGGSPQGCPVDSFLACPVTAPTGFRKVKSPKHVHASLLGMQPPAVVNLWEEHFLFQPSPSTQQTPLGACFGHGALKRGTAETGQKDKLTPSHSSSYA